MTANPDRILSVESLAVSVEGGRNIVSDVSLDVSSGEIVGLLGASGSGKTTTMNAILGLLPRNLLISAGRIVVDGSVLASSGSDSPAGVRGANMALIPQDPKAALTPVLTVGKQMSVIYETHFGKSKEKARAASIDALEQVHLPNPRRILESYPGELSGGMAQRVAIAIALLLGPRLLIADEPTTGLDLILQLKVLDLLSELVRERSLGMVIVSHDLGVISRYTDRISVMRDGLIVESGPTQSVFASPSHEFTRELIEASTLSGIVTSAEGGNDQ